MKRILLIAISYCLAFMLVTPIFTSHQSPEVRVVHASPDAPGFDVWVDGIPGFVNVHFRDVTPYTRQSAGKHNVQIVPAGITKPVILKADVDLRARKDYTIVVLNTFANIEPLILEDNNTTQPATGYAHIRFVQTSPDIPAVDIALTGGTVLFDGIPFRGVSDYRPVPAGIYDFQVKVSGTGIVALTMPEVKLEDGVVYTFFTMGLIGNEPTLTVFPIVDVTATRSLGSALLNRWR